MKTLDLTLPAGYERRIPLDLTQPCWPWTRNVSPEGYGRLVIDGQLKLAHRVAYQLHVGPIPRTWEIDHVCHSAAVELDGCAGGPCVHRSCWNPAHIEAVSSFINSMRGNHPTFTTARTDVCGRGHDLTNPANVYLRPDGRRRCEVCVNLRQRARRTAQKAVAS